MKHRFGIRNFIRAGWWLVVALPVAVLAAPTARQELRQALRKPPNIERGEALFVACSSCHGSTGEGQHDGAVPRIAGQHREVIIEQLVDFRHGRRWDHRMERYAAEHSLPDAQAIADVAAYVSRLPPRQTSGVGSGDHIGRGATIYLNLCKSCHGPAAEGNARKRIPSLAGQHYEYLLRQLYDAVEGRRPNFSRSHVRRLEDFVRDDFQGVADYLSRLPVNGAEPQQTEAHAHP